MTARFPELVTRARAALATNPACHDWDHTLRVVRNARHLARAEGADADVVECAALLHDIGRPAELADQGRTCHAEHGAALAAELLRELNIGTPTFVRRVAACVAAHRYRNRTGPGPGSMEAKVVFDADKLDCIGAVGIGRAFHFAGRIGARVHNTAAEALNAASYSREDTALREYLVKLRHIHECMLTAAGRRLATARYRFMVAYFEQLDTETRGDDVL